MKKLSLLKFVFFAVILSSLFFTSCGEDDDLPSPAITGEALFTYEADGFTVVFTNASTVSGTTTSSWDFGDGESSTEESPTHTYVGKGEYTVKLTVTDSKSDTHDITTKINVDKATRISITDSSLSDWDAVTEPEYTATLGDNSGKIISLVFDYDADNVYAKMSFEGTLLDSIILDMFIDTDFDATTGFASTLWPLAGLDILMEGPLLQDAFALYNYIGENQGWGWEDQVSTNHFSVGHASEENGIVTFEFALERDKIEGLDGDKAKFTIQLVSKTWAPIGWAPDQFQEGEDPTDGFTLIMN